MREIWRPPLQGADTRQIAQSILQVIQAHGLPLRYSLLTQPASMLVNVSPGTAPARAAADDALLFDATAVESTVTTFTIPYDYAENESVQPVIRWHKTTSATGEAVWWARHRWGQVDAVLPAYTATATGSARQAQPVAMDHLTEHIFPEISGTGAAAGSILQIEIGRAGGSYSADAALRSVDLIYPTNARGYDDPATKYLE